MATRIQGLTELRKKLAAMPRATKAEIRKVLEVSATEMVSLAKSLAPVDSGDLRDSIRSEPGRHDLAVVVRAGGALTTVPARAGNGEFDYSISVEHGTIDTPEQPFFWPSYRAVKKRAKNRATRAVRKAARRVIAGG